MTWLAYILGLVSSSRAVYSKEAFWFSSGSKSRMPCETCEKRFVALVQPGYPFPIEKFAPLATGGAAHLVDLLQ